jgi:hypothetical protein|tara:strand:+ start:123 stop:431 length:309 start_codon:yes stop_codon:yes gene_type:complete
MMNYQWDSRLFPADYAAKALFEPDRPPGHWDFKQQRFPLQRRRQQLSVDHLKSPIEVQELAVAAAISRIPPVPHAPYVSQQPDPVGLQDNTGAVAEFLGMRQ